MSAVSITEMIVPGARRGGFRGRHISSSTGPDTATNPANPDPSPDPAGCTASWSVWETTAQLTVTDPAALPAARRLVSRQFADVEKAAARFRRDAELHKLYRAGGRAITVSPLLADLVAAALVAAERTDGDVDPTVAAAMTAVHSHRPPGSLDRTGLPVCGSPAQSIQSIRSIQSSRSIRPVTGWQQVDLRGRRLQVPAGTTLDLNATAKAVACDWAAAQVRDRLQVGVLVELGGNAATAGPAPDGGWRVDVDDRSRTSPVTVVLAPGAALATSQFAARSPALGHLIDPRTGRAAIPVWRVASAIGFTCLEAASYTAAALVRGTSARAWLAQLWVPARLITRHDDAITVGPWAAHLVLQTPPTSMPPAPPVATSANNPPAPNDDAPRAASATPTAATLTSAPGPQAVANPRRTTL